MARTPAVVDTKILKLAVKEAKATQAEAKKGVTEAMSAFLSAATDKDAAKAYRDAVSLHIAAAKQAATAQAKLDAAA